MENERRDLVTVVMKGRRRRPPNGLAQQKHLLPSEKRERAYDLFSKRLSYFQIGEAMGISAIKARDLCLRHARILRERSRKDFEQELSGARCWFCSTADTQEECRRITTDALPASLKSQRVTHPNNCATRRTWVEDVS